ncbi:hypothetical protein [Algoriphagus litoralis]|uniref:hypothetical protein n=1 Tax=Algoriphagus litoralis TaxID=2202829 RepID=UPI000DB99D27|nr:hypothetical protein [Algoriphagus litoralis]
MKLKTKKIIFDLIAIISCSVVIGWIITDFFGGMILWFFSYGLILLPFLLLYVISFFDTVISLVWNGRKTSKPKLLAHSAVILFVIWFNLYHSEIFKSKKVMTATLIDDLSSNMLMFRENGVIENHESGVFGYSEITKWNYVIKGDLIIFSKELEDSNFIPDTLLLDKNQNAIFFKRDSKGNFITTKEWLNHFEIR